MRALQWPLLALLLAGPLLLLGRDLGHPALFGFDEAAHQTATRGLHDTGLPVIYAAPLVEQPLSAWWDAHVFLHKPPLPFALGALLMWLVGITPLALRLVSLASVLVAAVGLFLFGRRLVGPAPAALLAAAFLCLPFGYLLIQGYQFGDVTDCSLLACVALSMWLLLLAVERDSARLGAWAGALCGCGYLCKSALALVPLGTVGALGVLGALGLSPRLRLRLVLAFAAAAVAVALPWNLYSALKWPELYRWEAHHTLGFLTDQARYWSRPLDGVFNEVNQLEFGPWPVAIFPLAGLWLLWTAVRRRTALLWILCLWLWGSWLPLSLAVVKVPAHAWGAAPAALLAVALLLRDAFERPWLGGAALGALGTGLALRLLPALSTVRRIVPVGETSAQPGLAEGLALALALGLVGYAWSRTVGRRATSVPAWLAVAAAGLIGLVQAPLMTELPRLRFRSLAVDSHGDAGRALADTLPGNAVLFVAAQEPVYGRNRLNLMFYSGRMAYDADETLIQLARQSGHHPYLVSDIAQPYRRLAEPAGAWLQAFDLDAPGAAVEELPQGVVPVHRDLGALSVLGVAASRGDRDRDRYVFYVRSEKDMRMRALTLEFELDDGSVEHANLTAKPALAEPPPMANGPVESAAPERASSAWISDPTRSSWYTLAIAGPLRTRLRHLRLLGSDLPLP